MFHLGRTGIFRCNVIEKGNCCNVIEKRKKKRREEFHIGSPLPFFYFSVIKNYLYCSTTFCGIGST